MPVDDDKHTLKRELLLAFWLIAAGVAISGISLAEIAIENRVHTAQGTPPLQGSPPTDQDHKPAESRPGGERPTTPARPDPQTQGAAKQALPPAPAEKIAPPIQQK